MLNQRYCRSRNRDHESNPKHDQLLFLHAIILMMTICFHIQGMRSYIMQRQPHGKINRSTVVMMNPAKMARFDPTNDRMKKHWTNSIPRQQYDIDHHLGNQDRKPFSLFASLPSSMPSAREMNDDDAMDQYPNKNKNNNNNITTNNKISSIQRIRTTLRRVTGFSWTAFRTTLRTITGISLTTLYMTTMAMTNVYVRSIMKNVLYYVPSSLRYFIQPLLILYYVPLYIIKNFCYRHGIFFVASKDKEIDDDIMDRSWKQAVANADGTLANWPKPE